jgi:SagB-type dehydrogenase family enzyme
MSAGDDRYRLSLPQSVSVQREDGALALAGPRSGLRLEGPMLSLESVVEQLANGALQSELGAVLPDPGLTPLLFYLLAQMDARGLIARTAMAGETKVATLTPSAGKRALPKAPDGDGRWRLSRFTYQHREGDEALLESPQAMARVTLYAPAAAAILHRLTTPASRAELAAAGGLGAQATDDLLGLLIGGGFVETEDAAEAPAARLWEFHDLLFHGRSRLGRHDLPYGGAYLFTDEAEPLPALKPAGNGAQIPLPAAANDDVVPAGLAALMARRRSIRTHGADPISLGDVGGFLHRAARHLKTIDTEHGELAVRPYPAGGALCELELYLVVDRCQGLETGLYHYRPGDHALERMAESAPALQALLDQASATLSNAGRPQILIVIAARFQRLSFKYRAMVYALVLKHVGVLYQTFYLVATDMGLAPCAMGGGDSDLFAEASGLDPLVEASVGEFALGSRAEADVDAA